jgi:hypothetical protein
MHYRYFTLEQRDHLEQAIRERVSTPRILRRHSSACIRPTTAPAPHAASRCPTSS